MNSKYPFEEYIKNSLEQYEPEVPSHIWKKIDQNARRRPAFWLYFRKYGLLFLLLIAGGYGSFMFFSKTDKTTSHQETTQLASRTLINNEINTTQITNDIPGNVARSDSYKASSIHHSSSEATSTTSSEKNYRNTDAHAKTSMNSGSAAAGYSYKAKLRSSGRKKVRVMAGMVDESTDESPTERTATETASVNELSAGEITSFKDLLSRKNILMNVSAKPTKDLSIPCPGSGNEAWGKSYVDFYAGPDFVFRQLSDTPNSAYLEQRKQSSSFYFAYSAGLRFTKVFSNGLSFRIGLNYSEVTEKFDFIQGNIIQVIYVTDAAGDTIGSYRTSSSRHKVTFNKYRTLDIPVMAGYEWAKGKWNFGFNGGIILNVYSWNRGVVLDRSLQPVVINSDAKENPYQFKTNIGIGALASGAASYGLNDNLKIFAEPYFRFNLSSMSKTEQSLKQRFHTGGIRLGVRINMK